MHEVEARLLFIAYHLEIICPLKAQKRHNLCGSMEDTNTSPPLPQVEGETQTPPTPVPNPVETTTVNVEVTYAGTNENPINGGGGGEGEVAEDRVGGESRDVGPQVIVQRKRGRPRKHPVESPECLPSLQNLVPKRGRGRPPGTGKLQLLAAMGARVSTNHKSEFGPQTVIRCDQCEKEYHVGCLKEHEMDDQKELPEGKWFCCMDCQRIHYSLQTLVANGEEKLQEPLLNVTKKKLEEIGSDSSADLDIRWRLLSGKMVSVELMPSLRKLLLSFIET